MHEAEELYTRVKSLMALDALGEEPGLWIDLVAVLMRLVKRWRQPGTNKKATVMLVLEMIIERDVPATSRTAATAVVAGLSRGIDLAVRYRKWRWPRPTCCSK